MWAAPSTDPSQKTSWANSYVQTRAAPPRPAPRRPAPRRLSIRSNRYEKINNVVTAAIFAEKISWQRLHGKRAAGAHCRRLSHTHACAVAGTVRVADGIVIMVPEISSTTFMYLTIYKKEYRTTSNCFSCKLSTFCIIGNSLSSSSSPN